MSLPVEGSSHFSHDVNLDNLAKASSKSNSKNKLEVLGYDYNEDKDVYTKVVDENTYVTYSHSTKTVSIQKENKKLLKNIIYYLDTQSVVFSALNESDTLLVFFKYNVPLNKMECVKGECNNYRSDINLILRTYRDIKQILQ